MVTMNIDGLHIRAHDALNPTETDYHNQDSHRYAYCPDVFEIHGSIRYMYC